MIHFLQHCTAEEGWPLKKKTRRWRALLLPVQLALGAVMLVSAFNLGRILWGYRASAGRYEAIRQSVAAPAASGASSAEERPRVDMERLVEQYPDAVGWLYCEGTPIDHPVMQAEDNDYYLRRLPDGTHSAGGSLFLDWRCPGDFSGGLSVLYGHNMRDGSMFACLARYMDQEWCDAHPLLELQTPESGLTLQVAYAFTIAAGEWVDRGFGSAENRSQLVEYAAAHSPVSGVSLTGEEPLAALLTCTSRSDEERHVVLCALRRPL